MKNKKIIKTSLVLLISLAMLIIVAGCSGGTAKEVKAAANQSIKPLMAEFNMSIEYVNNGVEENYTVGGNVMQDYVNEYLTMESTLIHNDQSVQKIGLYFKPNKYGMKLYQCVDDINWSIPIQNPEKPIELMIASLSPSLSATLLKNVEDIEKKEAYQVDNINYDIYAGKIEGSNTGTFLSNTLILDFFGISIDDPTLLRDLSEIEVKFHIEPEFSRLVKMEIDMSSTMSQLIRRYGMRMADENMFEGVAITTCQLDIDLKHFGAGISILFPDELTRLEEGT